jgi:hypothetical protein
MTDRHRDPMRVDSPTTGAESGDVDACLGYQSLVMSQNPQDQRGALQQPHVRGDQREPLPAMNDDVADEEQQELNVSSRAARRILTIKKPLREKMKTMRKKINDVRDKNHTMLSILNSQILHKKSSRDVINGLHHASSSLQAKHPLFTHLMEYKKECDKEKERLKKPKEDESFANRQVSDSDCLKDQLASEIIRYCTTRVDKPRDDVLYIDEPGPCGESPVHLAFVLALKDLGNDSV